MGYPTVKAKLLYLFSRLTLSKDFKMLCGQYLKYCSAAPEMSDEIWKCLSSNYSLRRKYAGQLKFVSLGWNCLPRTLLTLWMLKASRGNGEKSMPFDLIGTPPKAAAHFLATDFADYFEGQWVYTTKNGYTCWFNEKWNDIFFPHERECGPSKEDFAVLKERVQKRFENFREAMAFEGSILFVFHKVKLWDLLPVDHREEDIENLCREIARIRGNKPFKILIFACDHNDDCKEIAGADLIRLPYPHANYIWHKKEHFSPDGIAFEMKLLNICRNAAEELLLANRKNTK